MQLAVSAGYEVLSTSSPKNFAYVKSLGVTQVFDYNSTTLVQDLLDALEGRELVGAYTIDEGAVDVCSTVMRQRDPKCTKKFITLAGNKIPDGEAYQSSLVTTKLMVSMMGMMVKSAIPHLMTGLEVKFILVNDMVEPKGWCPASIQISYCGR